MESCIILIFILGNSIIPTGIKCIILAKFTYLILVFQLEFQISEFWIWLELQLQFQNFGKSEIFQFQGYLYLVEKLFSSQDASDLLTLGKARSQVWIKNLPIAVESINNSVTKQLGISSTDAIKKRRVSSSPSYPRNGPVGYEEEKLPLDILSVSISLTQKNQPVLYWLVDNDSIESKRSLVRKELLVIPDDIELPPQKYTCEYLHNTGKPCYRSCMKLEGCRLHWKTKPCIPCAIYGNLQ
ncbi:7937_t:CDS:2, partial [Rhizophagus irregularis]